MRLLIATDAWRPQINGVVRSLEAVIDELTAQGVEIVVVSPADFRTVPLPLYPEIPLAFATRGALERRIADARPDAIHIATEGPVGRAARAACLSRRHAFTTSYHTRFPEYVRARLPVPISWTWELMRRFHAPSSAVMVSTRTLHDELATRGFRDLVRWSRGVDTTLFRPGAAHKPNLPRPIFLSVGRVAVEKNLDAFLSLDLPGSKVVVGDGPAREPLQRKYADAHFMGARTGADLAGFFAAADAFVFPSLTDTFGLVLLESLAAGTPVAAFPVAGPVDVVGGTDVAVLDHDLRSAALRALDIPRDRCRAFAETLSWQASARQFLDNLVDLSGRRLTWPDTIRGLSAMPGVARPGPETAGRSGIAVGT
jgi:glycosyltransferase involved in cell wall biosynthesis